MELYIRILGNWEDFKIVYVGFNKDKAYADVSEEEKNYSENIGGGYVSAETWKDESKVNETLISNWE